MDSAGIKMGPWLSKRVNNHRYFADRYDEDGKYYVFDQENGGEEVAGPFGGLLDAYAVAYKLNHPPRTILVHLNIEVPTDISLSPDVIADAILAGVQFVPVPEVYTRVLRDVHITVALAEEA